MSHDVSERGSAKVLRCTSLRALFTIWESGEKRGDQLVAKRGEGRVLYRGGLTDVEAEEKKTWLLDLNKAPDDKRSVVLSSQARQETVVR